MIWSPALQIFNIDKSIADCPDAVATAPMPPSSLLNFSSNADSVGLEILVYKCPSASKLNNA